MKKRVKIPVGNTSELLELAKKVQSKHIADGNSSLLSPLKWSEVSPVLEAAVSNHEKAMQMKRQMVEAYQQRDINLQSVIDILRDSRDILSGVYKKEMKILGQWGFDVLDVRTNLARITTEEAKVKE